MSRTFKVKNDCHNQILNFKLKPGTSYAETQKENSVCSKSWLQCLFLQEGPHCLIPEDEFYDAVDATLDKLEKEEEKVCIMKTVTLQ